MYIHFSISQFLHWAYSAGLTIRDTLFRLVSPVHYDDTWKVAVPRRNTNRRTGKWAKPYKVHKYPYFSSSCIKMRESEPASLFANKQLHCKECNYFLWEILHRNYFSLYTDTSTEAIDSFPNNKSLLCTSLFILMPKNQHHYFLVTAHCSIQLIVKQELLKHCKIFQKETHCTTKLLLTKKKQLWSPPADNSLPPGK